MNTWNEIRVSSLVFSFICSCFADAMLARPRVASWIGQRWVVRRTREVAGWVARRLRGVVGWVARRTRGEVGWGGVAFLVEVALDVVDDSSARVLSVRRRVPQWL